MFYLVDILRTQAQDAASQTAQRDCCEEVREQPGYVRVFQQRPGSGNIKILLLVKENQTSQVKEFSIFLCMGRCTSLGSLKSFLWYTPKLSEASILCFLILSLLRVHPRGWLQWLDGGHPVSIPSSLRAHHRGWGVAVMWWLDGGNILCLLIWQQHFLWHTPSLLSRFLYRLMQ